MTTATLNRKSTNVKNTKNQDTATLDMSTFIRDKNLDPNRVVKVDRNLSNDINYVHTINKLNELSHYFSPYREPKAAICLDIDIPADLLVMYTKGELQKGFKAYLDHIFTFKVKVIFISFNQVKSNKNPVIWNGENKVKFDPLKVNELLNYFYSYMIYNYPVN